MSILLDHLTDTVKFRRVVEVLGRKSEDGRRAAVRLYDRQDRDSLEFQLLVELVLGPLHVRRTQQSLHVVLRERMENEEDATAERLVGLGVRTWDITRFLGELAKTKKGAGLVLYNAAHVLELRVSDVA